MTTGHGPAALWAAIAAIGVGTYAIRVSFFYLFGRFDGVPAGVEATLRYAPPAILAALAVPAVVTLRPSVSATAFDPREPSGYSGFSCCNHASADRRCLRRRQLPQRELRHSSSSSRARRNAMTVSSRSWVISPGLRS